MAQPRYPVLTTVDGVAARNLSGPGGPAYCRAAGVSPHAQARQLAESCPELVEGMAEIEFSAILWPPRLRSELRLRD